MVFCGSLQILHYDRIYVNWIDSAIYRSSDTCIMLPLSYYSKHFDILKFFLLRSKKLFFNCNTQKLAFLKKIFNKIGLPPWAWYHGKTVCSTCCITKIKTIEGHVFELWFVKLYMSALKRDIPSNNNFEYTQPIDLRFTSFDA